VVLSDADDLAILEEAAELLIGPVLTKGQTQMAEAALER
jgi:hypothetical protein